MKINLISLFQNTVDKLVQRANASLLIGTSSWKEQFMEAWTVSPGNHIISELNPGYILTLTKLSIFWQRLSC